MSHYLETTKPSDYDTTRRWYCTIGAAELEWEARALVAHLQENGDEWRPVERSLLEDVSHLPGVSEMKEGWLASLQRVRVAKKVWTCSYSTVWGHYSMRLTRGKHSIIHDLRIHDLRIPLPLTIMRYAWAMEKALDRVMGSSDVEKTVQEWLEELK